MSEKDTASNIIDSYENTERLLVIGRLFKAGHISESEYLNLLQGDRNYFLTNTVKEIKDALENQTPLWSPTITYSTSTASGNVTPF